MKNLIGLILLTCPLAAAAQYAVVADEPANGQAIVGACNKPLPIKQSRNVGNSPRLVCGSAKINLPIRSAVRSDKWDDWSTLERSDSAGTIETRRRMQDLRLSEAPIIWAGQAKYKTFETWDYSIRRRGKNPDHCRVWTRSFSCSKTRQVPIRERRCHYVPDAPPPSVRPRDEQPDSPRSSAPPSRQRDPWDTPSTPRRNDGPKSSPRMDPDRRIERSNPSSPGGSKPGSGSNRRSSWDGFLISRAYAAEECDWVVTGYREETYTDTCHERMVDECEWEETHTAQRECSQETFNYSVEFAKPDPKWHPGQLGYHDLLPNKYDLLPGEWERYTLTLNEGGRSPVLQPTFAAENAWNKYRVEFTPNRLECHMNNSASIKAQVITESRIVRKAPNSLARPTDRMSKDRAIERGEYYGPDGTISKLRPTRIRLVDTSNETMMVASRQSRKFGDKDSDAIETEHKSADTFATAREMGFFKNTLLKVKLIEKNSCFGEGEKIFADVLDTSTRLTKGEGSNLLIPLDGADPTVDSFYRPYGLVGKILGLLPGGPVELFLNPGMEYEFRVSMLQQGLPFYENGCKNGSNTCEQEDANPRMYSEELRIEFLADDRRDERGWLQRFENWYGKKVWNKFRRCGGER